VQRQVQAFRFRRIAPNVTLDKEYRKGKLLSGRTFPLFYYQNEAYFRTTINVMNSSIKKRTFILLLWSILFTVVSFSSNTMQQKDLKKGIDSITFFKQLAYTSALRLDASSTAFYADEYIKRSQDLKFAQNSAFDPLKDSAPFQTLRSKYVSKFQWGAASYVYAGLIGFFIVALFFIQKRKDKPAIILLSLFIFIHSFFIIHVGLHWMNYGYQVPHTYAMSTVFSFLYGPLIYFYFKRIKTGYAFKWQDTLHLLPTLVLVVYFIPIYILSESDKLNIMLGVGKYEDRPYGLEIAFVKMVLLFIYTFFTVRLYLKNRNKTGAPEYKQIGAWQRNIAGFQVIFTFIYIIYWFSLVFYFLDAIMFHTQLIILSIFVLYVAYMAYVNPKTLMGYQLEAAFSKYKNSGLTDSYSIELKNEILKLLDEDKIYRENDLSLTILADRVGTNRHGASQVINEHFGLNYFELINQYRITEAVAMFKEDFERKQSIIDIAYAVGFNNKVTFNKAFKKIMNSTPSQYLITLHTKD